MALHSPVQKVGRVAAQAVAAIAAVELPQGQWPELIEILLGFVNNAANTPLRISTLNAIGYICESIVRAFVLGVWLRGLIARARAAGPRYPQRACERDLDGRGPKCAEGGDVP